MLVLQTHQSECFDALTGCEARNHRDINCMSSYNWPNSLDLFDYWLVTVQHLMESQCGALLEADVKALLSRLKSDAYLTELTGAVSVNILFIEQASSQRLKDNVT